MLKNRNVGMGRVMSVRGWVVISLAVAGSAGVARGQTDGTWVGTADGAWDVSSNWLGGIPNDGGVATFNENPLGGTRNIVLPEGFVPTISEIRINSVAAYNIGSNTGTGAFTLAGSGGTFNILRSPKNSPNLFFFGHTISASFDGGSLTKAGPGTVTLTSAQNAYSGGTFINEGILAVNTGATNLSFGGGFDAITISNNAALAVFNGGLTLNRGVVISPSGGKILNFSAMQLDRDLSGSGTLTRQVGNVALTLRANNTFTGTFVNNTGTVTLSGPNGSLRNAAALVFNGQLNIDSSLVATGNQTNLDRVGDNIPVTLRGTEVRLASAALANVTETLGEVTLTGGQSIFTVVPNTGSSAALTVIDLVRTNRATALIRGTSLGATPGTNVAQFATVSAPTLVGGGGAAGSQNISIVPWMNANSNATLTIAGATLVTRDSTTGFYRGLAVSEYATALGTATNNVIVGSTLASTAVTVPVGGATVNALNITSALNGTVNVPGTVAGTGTLTVSSGAIVTSSAATVQIQAPIAFPDGVEGVLHLQQNATVSNTFSGNAGITKTGGGQLTIVGNGNSSTYTGQTTIQGGGVTFTGNVPADGVTPSAFGISTTPIVLQPGVQSMFLRAAGNLTFSRDLLVENFATGDKLISAPTIAGFGNAVGNETVVMNGNIVMNRNLRLEFDPTPLATINGTISGTGQLSDAFASGQIFNSSNSFSGGINATSGTYLAGNDSAFGSGPIYGVGSVNATGGLVALPQFGAVGGPRTIANELNLTRGIQITGSETITFTGKVELNGSGNFAISATAPAIFTGDFVNGPIFKQFTGTMIVDRPVANITNAVTTIRGTLAFTGQLNTPGQVSAQTTSVVTAGVTNVFGGALVLNSAGTLTGVVADVGFLGTLGAGALVVVRPATTPGANTVIDTGGISIGNNGAPLGTRVYNGFIDMGNTDLIVQNGNVADIRDMVRAWTVAANGLPGTRGLGSSLSFYTVDGAFTTLAVYDNSGIGGSTTLTTFSGVSVLPTDVLVKYTYLGDTNLDGVVNATDLARILQGMNGAGTGWNFGDVNYDGVINFVDLGRAQAALRGQGAPLGGEGSVGGSGAIPEPAGLGLLLAAVPFMGRRRR